VLVTVFSVLTFLLLIGCDLESIDSEHKLNEFELRVIELTNLERINNGLNPLTLHNKLSYAAYKHTEDMHKNNFLSHTGSDGSTPRQRVERAGITGATIVNENAAFGYATPESVVRAWMDSSGHRANMLRETTTHIGVGYINGYWTQKMIRLN
jgi:uncharacterized protein YkwD